MPKKPAGKAQKPAPKPLVGKQPRSKQEAAQSSGMFLFTNDAWAARYFDPKDLHSLERELFG
jgi:hypothetical protein